MLKKALKVVSFYLLKGLYTGFDVGIVYEVTDFSFKAYDVHFAVDPRTLGFLLVREVCASFEEVRLERRVALLLLSVSL